MKKTFDCGHKGKGAYCHRCQYEEILVQQKQQARKQEAEQLQEAGVDLDKLPKHVAAKAVKIINDLRQGANYTQFKGSKRLVMRNMISIPLGYSHRILCRDEGEQVVPMEVLSHEAYNSRVRAAMSGRL